MQPYQSTHHTLIPTPLTYTHMPLSAGDEQLQRAIQYADKRELAGMIDNALKAGARLNHPECYACNALVIAVRENNHHAIAPLMARGAEIPATPPDGKTLLMEACQVRDASMAFKLIHVAKENIDAWDSSGKTALHYALFADSTSIVTLLLESGANPDIVANQLSSEETMAVFGHSPSPGAVWVTPLMVAVSRKNVQLTELLLKANANPNRGSCSPLIIAASHDHQAIFDALLTKKADLHHCQDVNGNKGLYACIASKMPPSYLSKLVPHHDFSADDGSVHSPLGLAVEQRLYDTCALLLSCGAPIEFHNQASGPQSLWDAALPGTMFSSQIAKLLTAARPANIPTHQPDSIRDLLNSIVDHINSPPWLASAGFFTSLLFHASEKLQVLSRQSGTLAPAQKALAAACLLRLPAPGSSGETPEENANLPPHKAWEIKADRALEQHRNLLHKACESYIAHCNKKMAEYITLNFFLECAAECPKGSNMKKFIANRVARESGAPTATATMIGDAWNKAAKWSLDWQVANDSDEESNRFLLVLMRNLLRVAADEPMVPMTALDLETRSALNKALPRESLPLHQFCLNPVAWLRKFEQRSSLADPDDNLAYQLQIALGLPHLTCEDIATAWKVAIRSARQMRWDTPAELQHVLDTQLAIHLNGKFPGESGKAMVSEITVQLFVNWSSPSLFRPPARSDTRKRPAELEPDDAPPLKEQRTSPSASLEQSSSED